MFRSQYRPQVIVEQQTGARAGLLKVRFRAMGTDCELHVPEGPAGEAFANEAVDWTQAFEQKYSRFLPTSVVSRINEAAGREPVAVDAETEMLLDLADALYEMSRGMLDATVLPAAALWDYHNPQPRAPSDAAVKAALARVGWRKVVREPGSVYLPEPGMALDFGGFGKEWAVDEVIGLARQHGLPYCLVDYGHDIAVLGQPPGSSHWIVGLEDPRHPGTFWARVALRDAAVASSGNYHRFIDIGGVRYGHIVDPRTGWPVMWDDGCVHVVSQSCLQAGMLSTSAFVLGAREGLDLIEQAFGSEGCAVTGGKHTLTHGFHAYLVE